ncbi:hypothetical protein ILUMI_08037 [Ignelater luminosus]|uniref:Uncharacterized protein n=1 Tax=Ignelater luminosus TaxID=2038154 RepID=A0A8K0GFS8_IGNLU|nr:hypothetical protein ILUMI_08037 [Ignelater luminosus]
MDSEHVVGDSDRGSRKRQRNTTSKERKKEISGCAGQNKNSHIVHMLMTWLHNEAPPIIKNITLYLSVGGHLYMPADRVFGSVVKNPEKYYELYSKIGLLRKLGTDWKIYNIKDALRSMNKIRGISEAKRILVKERQKLDNIKFPDVNLVHEIKHKKLWLLAVFAPDMNNHEDTNSQTEDDDEDVHEHVCECNEDDGGIKI